MSLFKSSTTKSVATMPSKQQDSSIADLPKQVIPIRIGESVSSKVHFSLADIAAFATACHDHNPLHRDENIAANSSFGSVIASCSHTPSMLMGLAASFFSRSDDGIKREMLGLNYNFAFKAPIYADEDIELEWRVVTVDWHTKLEGYLAQIDGRAITERSGDALIARGTILVKHCTS